MPREGNGVAVGTVRRVFAYCDVDVLVTSSIYRRRDFLHLLGSVDNNRDQVTEVAREL